jgi:hypothetical protein
MMSIGLGAMDMIVLPKQQTEIVLAEHAAVIRGLGKRVVADIIEIGRRLTDAKKIAGHGNWLPWLEREFGWSRQTADNFINVYEANGKVPNFGNLNLPLSGLYLLAKPSTPDEARAEVIERAEAGEHLSVADVQRIVDDALIERREATEYAGQLLVAPKTHAQPGRVAKCPPGKTLTGWCRHLIETTGGHITTEACKAAGIAYRVFCIGHDLIRLSGNRRLTAHDKGRVNAALAIFDENRAEEAIEGIKDIALAVWGPHAGHERKHEEGRVEAYLHAVAMIGEVAERMRTMSVPYLSEQEREDARDELKVAIAGLKDAFEKVG